MKALGLFLLLGLVCLVGAGEQNGQPAKVDLFERSVKLLRFGRTFDSFAPAKGDAVAALGLLGDDRSVAILAEHLAEEKDEHVRYLIARTLGWTKSAKAVPALEKALKDENDHVRQGAAIALKVITGKTYDVEPGPPHDEPAIAIGRGPAIGGRPAPAKPLLERDKSYRFTLARGQGGDIVGKVLEPPAGDWVKLQVRTGDKSTVSWVNLAAVAVITAEAGEK
jgi:hypothetical protein